MRVNYNKMATAVTVNEEIRIIFEENKMSDLKRFMAKRQSLNAANGWLIYAFHVFQSAGILTTTRATGYNIRELIWVGVGLNVISTLMNVFEKINTSISTKLMKDITSIREDRYVDEGTVVNDLKDKDKESNADSAD
jgi:hypothetical protein